MNENPAQLKSYLFALRMIKMYQHLTKEKREFILSKQVLRSGTSIGANIREANGAQSDKDFFAKIMIAYKESLETEYWLMLLLDSDYIEPKAAESILNDCRELQKILGSIKKTMRQRLKL
ncbi:MAG: four helix bundle protein [Victivallaceae bacterium]|nr:four helix bundle protein [Victivallaceae bacterium]